MKYIIIISLLLMSCDSKVIEAHNLASYNKEISDMTYYKDQKTNLCFAVYRLGSSTGAITNVPCTPEVEKQIK